MEYQEFAMVVSLPQARLAEWEKIITRARPPAGITCQVQTPLLLLITVQADMEFEAIEKAARWLNFLAQSALPAIELNLNPQPSSEV